MAQNSNNLKSAAISITSSGTIVTGVTGKVIKVYAVTIVCSAAISINFEDGTTDLSGVMPFAANGGFTSAINPPAYLFKTTAGNNLGITQSGAGTVAGFVSYWITDDF